MHGWCKAAWLHSWPPTVSSVLIIYWFWTEQYSFTLRPTGLLLSIIYCICVSSFVSAFSPASPHIHLSICTIFQSLSLSWLSTLSSHNTLFSICPSPLPCNDFPLSHTSQFAYCFSCIFPPPPFLYIFSRSLFLLFQLPSSPSSVGSFLPMQWRGGGYTTVDSCDFC